MLQVFLIPGISALAKIPVRLSTSLRAQKASICNKSAITDHVCNENHVIDWENAKVIDRESDKSDRHIREAIWIRKTDNMNRHEGNYQLSRVWGKLLHTDDRHRMTRSRS